MAKSKGAANVNNKGISAKTKAFPPGPGKKTSNNNPDVKGRK